jgi:adenylate cyclase
MSKFADDFAARQEAWSSAFGATRIGINTGRAIVGNFGGKARFDYTAHGDAIN